MAFKTLSHVTSRSYRKIVRVLEIFAEVRLMAVVLDFENETLIIKILKKFSRSSDILPKFCFSWICDTSKKIQTKTRTIHHSK